MGKRSDYINPTYAKKEVRTILGDKSKQVFGSRNKWKKYADNKGWNVEQIEEFMDESIKMIEEQLEKLRQEQIKAGETK